MLRYDRQIKPGLVALYDIWPRNGVGLFLQPRSAHGAVGITNLMNILLAVAFTFCFIIILYLLLLIDKNDFSRIQIWLSLHKITESSIW